MGENHREFRAGCGLGTQGLEGENLEVISTHQDLIPSLHLLGRISAKQLVYSRSEENPGNQGYQGIPEGKYKLLLLEHSPQLQHATCTPSVVYCATGWQPIGLGC